MPTEVSCWVLRNGETNGPYPLRAIAGAFKKGQVLPTDRFRTSPESPWKDWPAFVAEVKAQASPITPAAPVQEEAHAYRCSPQDWIMVRRANPAFPKRCMISNETSGLTMQTVHTVLPKDRAVLSKKEKGMEPGRWFWWVCFFGSKCAVGYFIGAQLVDDVVNFLESFVFKTEEDPQVGVEVHVAESAFRGWKKHNRRAGKWLLVCIAVSVVMLLTGGALLAVGFSSLAQWPAVIGYTLLGIGGFVGIFGSAACIAMRIVMGYRKLSFRIICFDDDWVWLTPMYCKNKEFIRSLPESPLPTPVRNWWFCGRYELPNDHA